MSVHPDLSRLLLTLASIASLCAVSSPALAQPNTAKNVLALYSEQVETENYAARGRLVANVDVRHQACCS